MCSSCPLPWKLEENFIQILDRTEYTFTREDAETFYENLASEADYSSIIDHMTSGSCEVLICAKGADEIYLELEKLIGKTAEEETEETKESAEGEEEESGKTG